jgi:ubiquinone/menaquinone biosynthesis C-methylase UbiE
MSNHTAVAWPEIALEAATEAAIGWTRHRELVWSSTRYVGERLVALVDPKPGERMLELAAGPGDTGLLAAAHLGSSGRLLATDLDPFALETIRRRADGFGLTNVDVAEVDARETRLPGGSFDGILFRFGLMLCSDPARALAECHRILRPGGRLALAVWSSRRKNPWGTVVPQALYELGFLQPTDPRAPGAFALEDPLVVRELVEDAYLTVQSEESAGVLWCYPSFDAYWEIVSQMSQVLITALRGLSGGDKAALRERLRDVCAPYLSSEGLMFPGVAHIVLATKTG